jgi:hypothetical protein
MATEQPKVPTPAQLDALAAESRQPDVIGVLCLYLALTSIAVGLRFLARRKAGAYLGVDDWMCLASWASNTLVICLAFVG